MIYYDHKRKAAGTFLRLELAKWFNCLFLYHTKQLVMSAHVGRNIELMAGHGLFDSMRKHPDDFYFTVIRHPALKMYSDYWYYQTVKQQGEANIVYRNWNPVDHRVANMTLMEFVDWFLSDPPDFPCRFSQFPPMAGG